MQPRLMLLNARQSGKQSCKVILFTQIVYSPMGLIDSFYRLVEIIMMPMMLASQQSGNNPAFVSHLLQKRVGRGRKKEGKRKKEKGRKKKKRKRKEKETFLYWAQLISCISFSFSSFYQISIYNIQTVPMTPAS